MNILVFLLVMCAQAIKADVQLEVAPHEEITVPRWEDAFFYGYDPVQRAQFLDEKNIKRAYALRDLYEKNNPLKRDIHRVLRIPKIIHQIWIGGPLPESVLKYQASWKKHHPTWQYMFWGNDDIEKFGMVNKKIFDAATNYAEKADIWRYEILYRYGGVYVDMDFECIKPLDMLHSMYDFYAGAQPIECPFIVINNAIIGAAPRHPIIRTCMNCVVRNQRKKTIFERTGPYLLTEAVFSKKFDEMGNIMIFPASYFYPIAWHQRVYSEQEQRKFLMPESYAAHYWANFAGYASVDS